MKSNIIIQKGKKQVIKICRSKKGFQKELYIYKKNLSFVPRLLDHNGVNTIMIEYIEGIPISDLLQPDFKKIAELFVELHSLDFKKGKRVCLNDSNPKNFLFCKKTRKYYMLDFSEWEYDYPESDLIHFLLFWASIYRASKFKKIFHQFINAYKNSLIINPIEWEMLVPEMILKFDSRRMKFFKIERKVNPHISKNREILTYIQ
jgi:tRNA A-37 threonylcarbamoyl transferase component Bud32